MRSTLKTNIAAVLAAAGMALAAPTVLAQSNVQGAIVGNVAKGSGAEVVIVSQDTGLTRTMTPDSEGRFAATALPTGRYSVTLKQAGQPDQSVDVLVTVGSNSVVRFDEMVMSEVVVTGERRVAAIDTSSVEANYQITAQELAELPVARTETAVALLAPGTTLGDYRFSGTNGGSSAGLASFSGSSVAENAYFVNGFNVTNFRNGLGGSTIPFEAYQDFQVKTGGYSAEFGRSTGGVVNTTTKRGTNQWKFGISAVTEIGDMRGNQDDVYYFDPELGRDILARSYKRDEIELTTANVEIGGPIIKDHLFIYGLYQFRDEKVTNWTELEQVYKDKNDDPFWLAKLDWKITDNHLLEGTYWSDKADVNRTVLAITDYDSKAVGAPVLEEGGGTALFKNGGENYVIKYTGYLTDTFTVSALYGSGEYDRTVTSSNDACPYVIDAIIGVVQGCALNLQVNALERDEREAYRIDFEWRLGDHQLRFGYDNEDNTSLSSTAYSGGVFEEGGEYWRYVRVTPGSTIQGGEVPAGVTEAARLRHYYIDGGFGVKSEAYYLEDNWQITDDFLLSVGIRNETFENLNKNGETFIKITDQWAPRLGFSWDVLGDGSAKLYGNAGRYFIPVASNTNVRLSGGEFFTQEYYTYSGIRDELTAAPVGLGEQIGDTAFFSDGTIPDVRTIVDQDIDPQYQDEFILGFQYQIGDFWTVGIKGVYRDLGVALEDIAVDTGLNAYAEANGIPGPIGRGFDYYILTNPGTDLTMAFDFDDGNGLQDILLTKEDLGFPKARRTYKAIELTAAREFNDDWYLKASYVWAEAKGNVEGYVNSDVGQDDAGITISFDTVGLTEGSYGKLPNNREHTFKLFGLYQFTPEWRISTNMLAQSGRPRSCFGLHPTELAAQLYGADSFYCGGELVNRGTRGETPWIYNIDLGVEWRPAFADDNLSVKLDVFNVFNFQDPLLQYEFGDTAEGEPDYEYLSTQRWQRPRIVRLGLTYNFGL